MIIWTSGVSLYGYLVCLHVTHLNARMISQLIQWILGNFEQVFQITYYMRIARDVKLLGKPNEIILNVSQLNSIVIPSIL